MVVYDMAVCGCIWSIAIVWEGSVTTWRVSRWVVTAPLFAAVATSDGLNLKQQKQSQKLSLFVAHCIEEHRPAQQLVGSGFRQTQALLQLAIQRIQISRFPSPLS